MPEETKSDGIVSDPILQVSGGITVNDDLRRSIQADIEELSRSAAKNQEQIKLQEKINAEIRKNVSYAKQEAANLLQGSIETLDVSKLNKQILIELEKTLHAEFSSSAKGGEEAKQSGEEVTSGHAFSISSMESSMMETTTELIKSKETLRKRAAELKDMARQKTELDAKTKLVEQQIATDQLETRIAEAEEKVEAARRDIEDERRHKEALQLKLQEENSKIDEKDAVVQKLVDELEKLREQHALEISLQTQRNNKVQEEVEKMKRKLAELQAEEAAVKAEAERFAKDIAEANAILSARKDKVAKRESAHAARLELTAERNTIEKEIASVKEQVVTIMHTISLEEEKAATLANHEFADKPMPDPATLVALEKERDQLKASLLELEDDSEIKQSEANRDKEKAKLELAKEEERELKQKLVVAKANATTEENDMASKLDALKEMKRSLETQIKESDQKDRVHSARILELKKCLAESKAAQEELDLETRKLEILRRGRDLLLETDRTVASILKQD